MLGCFLIGLIWIVALLHHRRRRHAAADHGPRPVQPGRRDRLHGRRLRLRDPLGVAAPGHRHDDTEPVSRTRSAARFCTSVDMAVQELHRWNFVHRVYPHCGQPRFGGTRRRNRSGGPASTEASAGVIGSRCGDLSGPGVRSRRQRRAAETRAAGRTGDRSRTAGSGRTEAGGGPGRPAELRRGGRSGSAWPPPPGRRCRRRRRAARCPVAAGVRRRGPRDQHARRPNRRGGPARR